MQLNLKTFFERAERYFPHNEIIWREADGALQQYRYADYCRRVRQLASALAGLGVGAGDRVGTLGWNTHRHLELYFAVPCMGAVLHTVNIRLSDQHLAYIINHAGDTVLLFDSDLQPLVERIAPLLATVRHYIVMGDAPARAPLPALHDYEALLSGGDPAFVFAERDENLACGMCFTSATTGDPKGVVYTQRGLYLHTMALCAVDVLGVAERDTLLPVVPMFHVNSWGLPYAAIATGAKLVLPGPQPTPAAILDLIQTQAVSLAAAAVTVGVQMHAALQRQRRDLSSLRGLLLGGSATPKALMRRYLDDYGVAILTAWGATECAPLATITHIRRELLDADAETRIEVRTRQGIPIAGVEIEVRDADGTLVPWDDRHAGEVRVRGLWIAGAYYRDPRSTDGFIDGWWKSGDIATVDAGGALRLVDRAKDLVKSGGEWISSVDLENELMACPGVAEAAVVGVPDRRWQERPAAYVVRADSGAALDEAQLRAWLQRRFPNWWIPDHYAFVDAIPKTGVGKINKRALREQAAADFSGT